ncbi:MAG: hypothetical protein F6J95_003550 [Leptolyngbya sp. SIO1E4]|nr:hypothetical protein [Leptolyngbya sp. SIO1E4]
MWGLVADQLLNFLGNEAPIIANTQEIFPTVNVLPGEPFDTSEVFLDEEQETATALVKRSDGEASELSDYVSQIPRVRNQNRPQEELPDYSGTSEQVSEGSVPFEPLGDAGYITAQLHDSSDGTVMLMPGDYEIPVTLFCMNQKASSPPGHRYVLAPLRGSRASIIAALNARAGGLDLDYQPLQVLSWNIQAGMAYSEMPAESQSLVDRLIPDYQDQLRGDFLQEIESTYNSLSGVAGLPSFNVALNQLGEVGRIVREYQQFRDTLVRYQSNYNRLFSELIPSGITTTAIGGATRTPWSKLDDRVYARMITENSAGGQGKFQIRVLAKRTPAGILLNAVQVAITSIIGDSQTEDVQSKTGIPEAQPTSPPTDVANEPSNNGATSDNENETPQTEDLPKPSAPIPDDPTQPPGEGWEWRGNGPNGSSEGAWYNPETGESLHPDLDHGPPIGPHWDYIDRDGNKWRIFPDGRQERE